MALFKILKGNSNGNINTAVPTAREGYCYFDEYDQKFYIDVATGTPSQTTRKTIRTDIADYSVRAGYDIAGNALSNFNISYNSTSNALVITQLNL